MDLCGSSVGRSDIPAKILILRSVQRIERDESSKILRYKARLVIHGSLIYTKDFHVATRSTNKWLGRHRMVLVKLDVSGIMNYTSA